MKVFCLIIAAIIEVALIMDWYRANLQNMELMSAMTFLGFILGLVVTCVVLDIKKGDNGNE